MSKHLLTMMVIALATCLGGCTGEETDEGGEATVEALAATEGAGDATAITLAKFTNRPVEAGCAKCVYKIDGVTECALAMDVFPYLAYSKIFVVEGTDIASHDVGLCSATRPAKVSGEARDDTHFVAANWEFTDE